ncbi:hypothetical protein ACJJTC_000672 [Scirpophaga incertulas]
MEMDCIVPFPLYPNHPALIGLPQLNSVTNRKYSEKLHRPKPRKLSLQDSSRAAGDRRVSIAPTQQALDEEDPGDQQKQNQLKPRRQRSLDRETTVRVVRKDNVDEPLLNVLTESVYKKMSDKNPHAVFVQLDELLSNADGSQHWTEKARWIKYEEDVEEGAERWGKPHVASLSFHSLTSLTKCLKEGVVILDLDANDLPGVAFRVVESMVEASLIDNDDMPIVMRSLLLRHKHVHEDKGFRFSIIRLDGRLSIPEAPRFSMFWFLNELSPTLHADSRTDNISLCNLTDQRRRKSSHVIPPTDRKKSSAATIDMREVEYLASAIVEDSQEDLKRGQNDPIRKRIPQDAEATTVLVGSVGFLEQPTIAFVRLSQGIHMPSITEIPIPVRFMFILLGPQNADLDYHEVGRSISTLMSNPTFHSIAYKADDRAQLLSGINDFLDDSIVLPPGDWEQKALLPFEDLKAKTEQIRRRKMKAIESEKKASAEEKKVLLDVERGRREEYDDPLERNGKPWGGLIRDIKRRYPHYLSDFTDALNGQCLAATIFMFFAALSSAITFGGLLAEKTEGQIGITETLVFTSAGGVVFSLTAGQPMMITGTTGPLLILDTSLSQFCTYCGFDFLASRMYCGLWMFVIAVVVASIEGSVTVKAITRFTEDIFAFLIAMIFIAEPIMSTINLYYTHPLGVDYAALNNGTILPTGPLNADPNNMPPQPNTALFSTMLTLVTFAIAYYLRIFRNGKFLGRSARRALGDFGVPIAIVLTVIVSAYTPVYTDTLRVPSGLSPTKNRPWLVLANKEALKTIPMWGILIMSLPALMIYIIVFMETHIAELIIDKPDRNLKKGSGFHLDIVVISCINAMCGMFGAPWQCVATVRSVSHVAALTVMSTTHAPGEKPHIVEVKEQRLTGLLVSILTGLSVLASHYLRLVPMAVLFGVFLYMGISSFGTIQFFERCILFFKPVKHHPDVPYVRKIPTLQMHLYTFIQVVAFCILFAVKSSNFSLALPFFLIMMIPLRKSLNRLFDPLHLRLLDGPQNLIDQEDEPDFYEQARML